MVVAFLSVCVQKRVALAIKGRGEGCPVCVWGSALNFTVWMSWLTVVQSLCCLFSVFLGPFLSVAVALQAGSKNICTVGVVP